MIQNLKNRTEKMQEFLNKDLEETNIKNSTIKNTLEGINTRITEAEK